MIGSVLKLFGGSKMIMITIAVLATTTLALGYTSKTLYDGKKSAQRDLEAASAAFTLATNKLHADIATQESKYAALSSAFEGQQKDYMAARVTSRKLRKRIDELAAASPDVQDLVDTPIPDDLYRSVFPSAGGDRTTNRD